MSICSLESRNALFFLCYVITWSSRWVPRNWSTTVGKECTLYRCDLVLNAHHCPSFSIHFTCILTYFSLPFLDQLPVSLYYFSSLLHFDVYCFYFSRWVTSAATCSNLLLYMFDLRECHLVGGMLKNCPRERWVYPVDRYFKMLGEKGAIQRKCFIYLFIYLSLLPYIKKEGL